MSKQQATKRLTTREGHTKASFCFDKVWGYDLLFDASDNILDLEILPSEGEELHHRLQEAPLDTPHSR